MLALLRGGSLSSSVPSFVTLLKFHFLHQTIPKLQFNSSINKYTTRQIFTNCPLKKPKTSHKLSPFEKLLVGGTCAVTFAFRYNRIVVSCSSANRLAGYQTNVIKNDSIAFDWHQFWRYLKPYLLKFLGAIAAALAVAYFNIKIPELLGVFVNALAGYARIGNSDDFDATQFLMSMKAPAMNLFGMYVLQSGFTFLYILLLSQIGEQMAARLRQDLFKQIILQDLSFFDENRTGELVNRLTTDVQDFKSCFKQCVSQGLRSIAQLIGGSISLFLISPKLATVALVSVPFAVVIMSLLGGALRSLSKKSQAQAEKATALCEEALSNIRTVRSSACEFSEIKMFGKETNSAAELSEKLGVGIAVFQALTNLFLNGMVLSTLFLGGHLMASSDITAGQLMAFLVASQGVQRSLSQGSILLGTLIRGCTAGNRVFEYLAIEPKIDLISGITIPFEKLSGEICFQNVSFSYPRRPDQVILRDFNLVLKPGQTVALVGASGSGKSTVASLLERFYEPNEGSITLDGRPISILSPNWLRAEIIGFIEQQPILFGTTILENIRYGRPLATKDEVYTASKLAQSHEFISRLNEGYETNVGERGVQLSGGQRQRIAIARALLKQPIILILDEATSALDASSEAIVQQALDKAMENRTTLVIAHRLSTIKNADLIVVMDQGKIVEQGTHDSLMKLKGYYYDLIRKQEKMSKEEVSRAQG
ncbi:mitochondrial potassium channel ATP-binding subunit [Sitodiplosis mosellana]|uniref:mitochondrial potassium channel ATP-binding subunit n=1 Tax=Sitodiplosis mosellana TaxID=263140 RepID=UPI002443D7E6|nr:mitochondrial potassium channel ATP-binding subunit [Sitodiplosis mosellana]